MIKRISTPAAFVTLAAGMLATLDFGVDTSKPAKRLAPPLCDWEPVPASSEGSDVVRWYREKTRAAKGHGRQIAIADHVRALVARGILKAVRA